MSTSLCDASRRTDEMAKHGSRVDASGSIAGRWAGPMLGSVLLLLGGAPAKAETLVEAMVKAYQSNPQLNAARARQRATDENVPQALSGYRPQIVASLSAGLQQVRNLLPDNVVQTATLKPWTVGLTVTQTLFNGFKTANNVRVAEAQVRSGREALRNVGQGILLDAVTVYMNVLANGALVDAQRANIAFLRQTLSNTRTRLNAGDVTPTDAAQAEARLSRGLADLNAADVALAVSKATYGQVVGEPPAQLLAATPVDRFSPPTLADATNVARQENPAVLAAQFDVDVAQSSIAVAESGLLPTVSVQASVSRAGRMILPSRLPAWIRLRFWARSAFPSTMQAWPPPRPARPRRSLRKAGWSWSRCAIRRALRQPALGSPMREQKSRSPPQNPRCVPRTWRYWGCSGRRRQDSARRSTYSTPCRI